MHQSSPAVNEPIMDAADFPLDVSGYAPLSLNPQGADLSAGTRAQWERNIGIVRDTIVFFTAVAAGKGLGGHTGGAYDIVPEALMVDGFIRGSDAVYPALFDEAGHRVALQYAMAAFNGSMPFEKLLHYREYGQWLYGHPELDRNIGVMFSSGRLGHLWAFANGVALAHPDQAVIVFGSDGSQQEGEDAEAARLAVAQDLNIKLIIDDNNVTIAGHPQDYLPGFDIERTLLGHGMTVDAGDGEDLTSLYGRIQKAVSTRGPMALVNRRLMAPGVEGIEGSTQGHDVIPVEFAIEYLTRKGHDDAVAYLKGVTKQKVSVSYRGSSTEMSKNRDEFGKIICEILRGMTPNDRIANVAVVDNDLAGSCGLAHVKKAFPEVFVSGGVMERGNFGAAAGFGFEEGKQGIYATFSAFLEMVVSEITMARLNEADVLAHFSHGGVDDMADNTCHFGVNNFFADTGLLDDKTTRLYFAADVHQLRAVVKRVFNDRGLRFVFSTRSAVPEILGEDGAPMYGGDYAFEPDHDEIVREGSAGYVVSYGEMLYRALDAVERAREQGVDVGLVNKPTLNVFDNAMMKRLGATPFVLVVESQNQKSGLGVRMGAALLQQGSPPKFDHMGAIRNGEGGLSEQIPHQGLSPDDILKRIHALRG